MSFESLGLSQPLLDSIKLVGYTKPSEIQNKAIPIILKGRDIMAAAQTGTGKTAGFTLPMIENLSKGERPRSNQARALILAPTRELAIQVGESVEKYSQNLNIRSTVVYGGVKINPQMLRLRKGVDILVATPGRLLDLYQHNAVKFQQLEVLVLDEADRMLDMGFIHDIKKIINALPKKRQNLMFSATFSPQIRELAKGLVNDPVEVSVTPRNTTAKSVKQWIAPVDKKQKPSLLVKLISENNWSQVLVFSKTKHGANKLVTFLENKGISALAIHGNKSQGARVRALEAFKNHEIQVLVATDIAARGLDISQLPVVVNVDLPKVPEDYVHRIGRTGRAGAVGLAVSLVSADEVNELSNIERLTQKVLERIEVEGFEPHHVVPVTSKVLKPPRVKKPKKKKSASTQKSTTSGATDKRQVASPKRKKTKPKGKGRPDWARSTKAAKPKSASKRRRPKPAPKK